MKCALVAILLFLSQSCMAQSNISGIVQDSITNQPLAMANVTLLKDGKPISFTRTNVDGQFNIQGKQNDMIVVSFLGYQKKTVPISEETIIIRLIPEAFNLKEVEVKGGRILGHADTITYDLSRFSNERDNSLNDVLKKLPGIDVSKNGQIMYNGKAIDRFTIEGLDLTGGKYNKINEALKPNEVDKAEVIEHDQPIKALKDKVFTDNVAMNIKLKEDARDKWLGTFSFTKPITPKVVCEKIDILQLGKTRQQMYNIETDKTGRDIYAANQRLTSTQLPSFSLPSLPSIHHNPTLTFPIDDERMRQNSSSDIRFAKTTKNKNEKEMRWGTEYLHSSESQQTSNNTLYYLGDNTKIMSEESNLQRNVDKITLDYTLKKNNDKAYGNEYLLIEGSRTRTLSTIGTMETLSEKTNTPHLHVSNSMHRIFVKKHHQYSLSSIIDYQHSPTSLSINDEDNKLTISQWYVDHHFSMMFPRLRNTFSYQIGCTFHHLNVGKRWTKYVIDGETRWEIKRKHTTWRMALPIKWEYHTPTHKGYLCLSPHALMDKTWKKR
ncbi:MAG: carboxypeptidase-like regulatory domain-containing protein, partial [Prevotella sp.]|nr:carboxypeptidase-like regulatory domain-containing protein [Prevotella sp.]